MDHEKDFLIRLFCPNCGARLSGDKNETGCCKINCPRCNAKIFSKQKSEAEINFKVKRR